MILVLDVDGRLTQHEFPEDFLSFSYEHINCSLVDRINLNNRVDMWVDDEGLYTQEPNRRATVLARIMGYPAHMLCGPVVIAGISYTEDGREAGPLKPEEIEALEFLIDITEQDKI